MPQSYILAKVKRKTELCRVLTSDTDVYDILTETLVGVEYNPNTLLQDEEIYQIANFSRTAFSQSFLTEDFDSTNFNQISTEELKNLSYLCTVQGDLYCFQIINSRLIIDKKWFSLNEPRLLVNEPIITIRPYPDVVYRKDTDTLFFKKLPAANKIFHGMDQLFREATNEETENFLQQEFLDIQGDFGISRVSVPNRKRIAMVMETLNNYSEEEKTAIHTYTTGYCNIIFENGRFKIENDEDLKNILWGIEQRYYTTPIGGERRVANSIITVQD